MAPWCAARRGFRARRARFAHTAGAAERAAAGGSLEAMREADLILVGPGSLYTSIIPNLLVKQVTEVLANSKAARVYIANLMTQPGETDRFSVADHVRAIYEHTRQGLIRLGGGESDAGAGAGAAALCAQGRGAGARIIA